jgi:hypothetical protein
MASVDFFAVPTVLLVLAHERGRIVHFAVTAHPMAEWVFNNWICQEPP